MKSRTNQKPDETSAGTPSKAGRSNKLRPRLTKPGCARKAKPGVEPARRDSKSNGKATPAASAASIAKRDSLPAAVGNGWIVCQNHPGVAYRSGGFCTNCFAEQTQDRVKALDDGFAALTATALQRLNDIFQLPADSAVDPRMLRITLGPVMRAIEVLERRFKRPEQLEVAANVKTVALIGSPVDYSAAKEAKP